MMGLYLFFFHLTILLAVCEFSALCYQLPLPDDIIALNCGSSGNSTALDGRHWTGDVASRYIILHGSRGRRKLVSSTPLGKHLIPPPPHPVPYMTALISRSTFTYTFHLTPGQKFIRLHFYPTEYPGFERSKAFFTVKAGPYTLLSNFSAALTADGLALPSFAKEFCVHVEDSQPLILTFSPSSAEAYAFVNGIEIVSIPTGLYHSREGDDPGVQVLGKKFRYPIFLDTSFALETVHRLNVGGSSISPIEDTGMFREWFEDSNYFLESRAMPVTTTIRINYTVIPTYSAPTRVYQTSRSMARDMQAKERISFTWKLPVDQGFRYMLRFHFCELEYEIKEVGQMEFSIFIDNQIAEANADLIKWAGGNGIAVYRDYMATMEGDRTEGKRDMTITLSPHKSHDNKENMEHSSDAILKGLEVFKLSNPDNNLAGVNMFPIAHALTSHNSKPQKVVLGCGIYTTANSLISLLIILNVVVYPLAYLGQKYGQGDTLSSLPSKGPYRRFSLAELQSATKNFDNGLIIGSGGFGNVYKGLINGGTTRVAIKRMKPKSRQGPNEFWMEIETISKFRHKHLVSLLGYCDECNEKILVYEYMEQGTLAKHLYKKNTEENGNVCHIPWEQRLKICIGAARGLDYLHTGIHGGVIHRDVKTTNILLNKDVVAKVSDFGLCKMGTTSPSVSHVTTVVKGTFGYFDPHYFLTRVLTKKSDVYAFGVVLLEVLCGRPAVDLSLEEEQQSLSFWAQGCLKVGKLDEIIDPILRDQLPILSKSLEVFAEVAGKCPHTRPNRRPTMADVVVRLERALAYLQDDRCKDSSTKQVNKGIVNVDAADEVKENVLNLGGAEEKENDEIIQLDDEALLAEVPSRSTAVQYTEKIPLSKKRAQGKLTKVLHTISTTLLPRTVDFGWLNRKVNYYCYGSRYLVLCSDSNSGLLSYKTTLWHHTGSCWTDKATISAGSRQSMSTISGRGPYFVLELDSHGIQGFKEWQSLIRCASVAERNLLADTSKIVEKHKACKRKDNLRKIVSDGLLLLGYGASICKSRWEKSSSYPAGEYEYIDVIVEGERLLVDIDFTSEFEIARSTRGYKAILQSLPYVFVGKADRLQQIVSIVSEAARQSLKKKGMPIPPWRKADYVRAKWLSPHTRTSTTPLKTDAVQTDGPAEKAEDKPRPATSESDCREFELIFGEEASSSSELEPAEISTPSVEEMNIPAEPSQWQPPAVKPKSCERGGKVVTGLASLLREEP